MDFRFLKAVYSVLSAQELDGNPVTMTKPACSAIRGLSIVSKRVHCWQVHTCVVCVAVEMVAVL